MKPKTFLQVREFGKENQKALCLIHPTLVRWDYFDYVIPLLEKHFHLIVPSLPGYDLENDSEFCSVECVAVSLASYLKRKGICKLDFLYGCSMGGAIALRMLIDCFSPSASQKSSFVFRSGRIWNGQRTLLISIHRKDIHSCKFLQIKEYFIVQERPEGRLGEKSS